VPDRTNGVRTPEMMAVRLLMHPVTHRLRPRFRGGVTGFDPALR
jgi:hypothetical protein